MIYSTRSHNLRGMRRVSLSILALILCLIYLANWPAHAGRDDGRSAIGGPNPTQAAAIRNLPGLLANTLPRNDDSSTGAVPLGFTINFLGTNYSNVFVNNNGNVTFDTALSNFTPFPLTAAQRVIIAAFFADVDTRGAASGVVTYGNDTVNGRPAFGVNWVNVGYFASHTDKLNSFQLVLINRSDTGPGNFDIEFNYNNILWETGDASGGTGGLGGSSARAGYSNGTASPGTSAELSGSAINGAFLDSNLSLGLIHNSVNSSQLGRYMFAVRGGAVQPTEDITGSYGGRTSGTASSCTDPSGNGPYQTDINIRVAQPIIDGGGVRRFNGLITLAGASPDGRDIVLDMSAALSDPGNDRTLTNGALTVRWPAGVTGAGTVTGQWLRARAGNPDQIILNYTAQGSAFGQGCSLSGSVNVFRLGVPPIITFSPGILSHPPGSLDPLVQIVQQNGRFQITPRSNMPGLRYNGFVSNQFLNVSNFNVSVQAQQTGTGGAQTVFGLVENSDNFMRFVKVDGSPTVTTHPDGSLEPSHVSDTTTAFLIFQVKVNGVLSSFNIPYDGVLHRFWRFRNEPSTNTVTFDTSPDQIVWTVQHRVVLQRSVSALTAELSAGTSTSVANPGMAVFQNFMLTSNPPATGSPLDGAEFLVRAHYYDFLNRDPDASGIAFWSNQITSCGTDTGCIELRRINVSAAFFISIEFQQTGYLVYRIYKAAHGNLPGTPVPVRFNEFLPDTQRIGLGVVVNQTGWEQVLENNKIAFAAEFVARDRFVTAHPTTRTPGQFVDTLFTNAGVTPSSSDRQAIINEFGPATNTADTAARGRALRRVAEHPTFAQQEFNRAFVLMQYLGYLRRNPNDAPDGNFDGYNFWLGKLNQFNGNFVNAEMVKAFIVSGEYQQRFGP